MPSPRAMVTMSAVFGVMTAIGCPRREAATAVPPPPHELRIAAASSTKPALEDLSASFQASNPGIKIVATYGASGNLFAQISNKAPFDVFLSADTAYPRKLAETGQAGGPDRVYAVGVLVLWVPAASALKPESLGLRVLTDPAIRHVAIANPQHAPYGRAAEAAMNAAGVYDAVRPKLVLGENVEQTAQFVLSGAADIALVPLSLAVLPAMKDAGRHVEIDASLYPPIQQALVTTAWARVPADAGAFCDHVLSRAGQTILARHGFRPPPGN